ncbi:MAG: YfhO family protein [Bryobacteraceae bacterium]
MTKPTLKALAALLVATILYYWKILLTSQFSLLTGRESVSQAYSWFHFWIRSIRHGSLPLWDPYSFAGRSFPGEMQTAAFYPLNFLLLLFPFDHAGVFSLWSYHIWYAFAHFLGACFMYALARELGLRRFAAIVAGLCFSLGGFVEGSGWPHMLHSSIWLPLIFLFLVRAMRADSLRRVLLYSSLSGIFLGLAILAGGFHVVIMEALVIASAAVFVAFQPQLQGNRFGNSRWIIPALAASVAAVVGLCAGAIQLFPSMEYSALALRWLSTSGSLPATAKIPYALITPDSLPPYGILEMLLPSLRFGAGVYFYIGIFPLIAVIAAIWKRWANPWVRYLAGLAAASFLYSLGEYSFLHGVLYALVPRLWMAREPYRFVFLVDFAVAILAAFGVDTLLAPETHKANWNALSRVLAGVAIVCALAMTVPPLLGHPESNPWVSLSILLIFSSCGLFWYIAKGHVGLASRLLIVGLLLFDLGAFEWSPQNKIETARTGTDHLDLLLSCRGTAEFLKSRPGIFRVLAPGDNGPNLGDVFELRTMQGGAVTLLTDYLPLHLNHWDLLNVRYLLKPASTQDPGAIYQDASWKVYENPKAFPAAWLVHDTITEPSRERLFARLDDQAVDLHRMALLDRPLGAALDPPIAGAPEEARFLAYQANRLDLTVHAQSRGLLVLSENFYPGWRATVNGADAPIHKVDGGLRGIVVPRGESRIVLRYAPWTVFAGALLTLLTFAGTLLAAALDWRAHRSKPACEVEAGAC